MIRIALSLILIFGIQIKVHSQENVQNELDAKEWSLSFGIDQIFTLKSFQGSTISLSKYISSNEEIRFGFSNSFNGKTSKRNSNYFADDTLYSFEKSDGENNPKSFSLICQYQNHFQKRGNITAYFSTGPSLSYSSSFSENENTENDFSNTVGKSISNSEGTNFSIGLMNSLGVEWDFHQSLSVHAEYQIYAGYTWNDNKSKSTTERFFPNDDIWKRVSETKSKDSGWVISNSNLLFGLSVFF